MDRAILRCPLIATVKHLVNIATLAVAVGKRLSSAKAFLSAPR
jgi:hypothetical protein